jgi:hypothetical protein
MSYAGPLSQLVRHSLLLSSPSRNMARLWHSLAHLIFQYLGPLSQASHPSTGTLYPATVLQLLRAEQPHLESKFILDGIKLDRVLRKVFPDNKFSYMRHLGYMRGMYC